MGYDQNLHKYGALLILADICKVIRAVLLITSAKQMSNNFALRFRSTYFVLISSQIELVCIYQSFRNLKENFDGRKSHKQISSLVKFFVYLYVPEPSSIF